MNKNITFTANCINFTEKLFTGNKIKFTEKRNKFTDKNNRNLLRFNYTYLNYILNTYEQSRIRYFNQKVDLKKNDCSISPYELERRFLKY